jgi:glycosyltransferase involved in cell wall biosynthesis
VDAERLQVMHLTLTHFEGIRPRAMDPARRPLTFGTLAGLESTAKGARLMLDAIKLLGPGGHRVLVFGHLHPDYVDEARALPGVELRGTYAPETLDTILEEVDVGLMPSIWEEAYGYAGIEFLAKGIPVIANAIGGMVDFVRDGETGWLNRSHSAEELAAIMRAAIDRPERVAELNRRIVAGRDAIVKPIGRHADEVDALYRELAGNGYDRAA